MMKIRTIIRFFFICVVILPSNGYSFDTLTQAQDYAKTLEEYPDIDNDNWLNPSFSSTQKKLVPNIFSRALIDLGLKKPLWKAQEFRDLLLNITKKRELDGYLGRFVQIIKPEAGQSFYIWGDLHGAFHSLVRCLIYLESTGVIDNSFNIKDKKNFFVFNGNAIDQSPYSLDTLTLILHLMKKNPENIFYLRGFHEDRQAWHDLGLGAELQIRAQFLSDQKIPLNDQVTKFFDTLPLSLYLVGTDDGSKVNFVRISPSNRKNLEITESKFGQYLENPPKNHSEVHLHVDAKPTKKQLVMNAIIEDEDRTKQFTQTRGLVLLEPEEEATAWAVLSAPTGTYRRMFDFFYDAFAVLTITPKITDWTISFYNQDLREKLGFALDREYVLSTGIIKGKALISKPALEKEAPATLESEVAALKKQVAELQQKATTTEQKTEKPVAVPAVIPQKIAAKQAPVTQKMLTFGSTLDLSKGERFKGKQLRAAMSAVFKHAEPIDGVMPSVLFADDEYTPERARENVERFIAQGIDKTIISMGSPTIAKYLDLIKARKIAVFFPFTGSPLLRDPNLKYLVNFRKSYADEAKIAITYALEKAGARKLVILYQNDAYGLGALEGVKQLAKEKGIDYLKEWNPISYERADLNMNAQAEKIKSINPDAIIFLSVVNAVKEIIRILGIPFFDQKKLFSLSDLSDQDFTNFAKEKGIHVIITNVVPDPQNSPLPIAQEFRSLMKQENIQIDTAAFESYIGASLMLDILKKIDGDVSDEAIIEQLEHLKNYDFKGLTLNFDPETRELSPYLWVNEGEGDWVKFEVKPQSSAPQVAPEVPKPGKLEQPAQSTKNQITENTLTFGSTLDLSKGERFAGTQLKAGMSLALKKNRDEEGGINGVSPKIVFLDDEYSPDKARENAERFINDGISKNICSLGTPTLEAYIDLVNQHKMAIFFPATGASIFRKPELNYLINLRNSFKQETKTLVEYTMDTEKSKKIAFFIQNDEYGNGCFEGALLVAKNRNIDQQKDWKIVYYQRNEVNLTKQAEEIKSFNPDAILFLAVPTPVKELIRLLEPAYLADKKLLGVSDFGQSAFKKFIQEKGLHVTNTNIVPNPMRTSIQLVTEFRKYAEKNNIEIDTNALEGYLSVAVMLDTLKKIKGAITPETIIKELESIKDYNFKGLMLNFNKETRELLNSIWIDTGAADWVQKTI